MELTDLPRSKSFPEFMVSLDFSYLVIFHGRTLSMDMSLREAGVSEGNSVHLSVSPGWRDELKGVKGWAEIV